jgi:hypothetical protein
MTPLSSAPTKVMPVAHHPAPTACATKFSRPYPNPDDRGGIELLPQEEAFADPVLQAGGSGT